RNFHVTGVQTCALPILVPGLVMYKLLEGIQMNYEQYQVTEEFFFMKTVPFLGFIITLGSGLRLAKFNVDTRQTDSFIGLPTPAKIGRAACRERGYVVRE